MEVAPFFVDFHHFLSIFTIFCRFSPFFIDFHDLRTFVAIYILSRFTHFFRNFFLAKIAFSATSHVFCMYDDTCSFIEVSHKIKMRTSNITYIASTLNGFVKMNCMLPLKAIKYILLVCNKIKVNGKKLSYILLLFKHIVQHI